MIVKLMCSSDCGNEVDVDPNDDAYSVDELRKMERYCFTCQQARRAAAEKAAERVREKLLAALKPAQHDINRILVETQGHDKINASQALEWTQQAQTVLGRALRAVENLSP